MNEQTTPVDDYERIAAGIRAIGDVGKKLSATGLNRNATILLIHDATKVPKRDIKLILDALPSLPRWYLAAKLDAKAKR